MAPRGPLGGRESQDPQALQEPWGHLVSLGLKDFQDLQAQLGQMDPQGHPDSQGLRVPPGCLGTKDPLVPQDLHRSLANQGSEGSQDSQDQRVRRASMGCQACQGALAGPESRGPRACPVPWGHQDHQETTGATHATLDTVDWPCSRAPREKRATLESRGAATGNTGANRATSPSLALAASPAPGGPSAGTRRMAKRNRRFTEPSSPMVFEVPPGTPAPLGPPGPPGPPGLLYLNRVHPMHAQPPCKQPASADRSWPSDAGVPQTEPSDSGADLRRQTWVFKSKELMVKASSAVPEGSLVYVREGSNAFLRTPTGWSRLLLEDPNSFLAGDDPSASTPQYQEVKRVQPRGPNTLSPMQSPTESLIQKEEEQGLPQILPTTIAPRIPSLRLAALNVPLSGDMSGIRGADLQCYRQSQEAGLHSTFRAFLSAPTQHLVSIVKRTDRTLPIINLKGQLLAKSWSSLFGGQSGAALRGPIYSFNGRNVLTDPLWPQRLAWHGSTPRGGHARRWDCQGWRSSGTAEGMAAALGEGRLLAGHRRNCSTPLAVLCVEVAFPYRHMW
ncbi:collagen alpha-1(XV) chain-like [Hirundo rustica]|uniref:collagen alpha-1(XV) chain-like n=1 Tax=Hirundo rustica TaxID=43150 RepID=UPI001A94540B|nr:collagen alpha-1(XV) chain-like [Hirundo rustica]